MSLKRLPPVLVIATLAHAQAQAQEAVSPPPKISLSAPVSKPPPRSARADVREQSAPASVRRMAAWVRASADNNGVPFVIVDKKDASVFVFDRRGQMLGAAPALLGLAVGDDSIPGIGEMALSAIPPKDRTTPAGRFVGYLDQHSGKPNFLWVDYKNNVSLHRVVHGRAKDQRLQRLATPTASDNRISFGCINVPAQFFDRIVNPTFKNSKGVIYVLPELRAMRDFFARYQDLDE